MVMEMDIGEGVVDLRRSIGLQIRIAIRQRIDVNISIVDTCLLYRQ